MATAPLERTRQSPKLITSTCRKVFSVYREEVEAGVRRRGEGLTSRECPMVMMKAK